MTLAELLTVELVQSLAGAKSFARGMAYFQEGAVGLLEEDGNSVTATVQGTHRYRVSLAVDEEELEYDCTCPVGTPRLRAASPTTMPIGWVPGTRITERGAARAKAAATAAPNPRHRAR